MLMLQKDLSCRNIHGGLVRQNFNQSPLAASPGPPSRAGFARAGVGARLARRAACYERKRMKVLTNLSGGLERSDKD